MSDKNNSAGPSKGAGAQKPASASDAASSFTMQSEAACARMAASFAASSFAASSFAASSFAATAPAVVFTTVSCAVSIGFAPPIERASCNIAPF